MKQGIALPNERIATLNERFATLNKRIATLNERFATLNERIATLNERFIRLNQCIARWDGPSAGSTPGLSVQNPGVDGGELGGGWVHKRWAGGIAWHEARFEAERWGSRTFHR